MNRTNQHLRQRKIKALMIVTRDGEVIEPDLDFYDAMLHLDDSFLDVDYHLKVKQRADRDCSRLLSTFGYDVEKLALRLSRLGYDMASVRLSLLERCFDALGFIKE